jgi:hypothetical protein
MGPQMNDIRPPDAEVECEDEGLLDDRYHLGRIDGEDRFCEIILRQFRSDVDEAPSDCNTIPIAVTGCAGLNADYSGATD